MENASVFIPTDDDHPSSPSVDRIAIEFACLPNVLIQVNSSGWRFEVSYAIVQLVS
jgi:hypothetical protein